jgi:alpha-N-arabinofuranosidase
MANVAQTVNCIHSLFLAHEDQYTRTPPYYVFELYRPHMGARQVAVDIRADQMTVPAKDGDAKIPALSASASIRDSQVTVTVSNPSVDSPLAARIRFAGGATPTEARASVLTHADMRARNTFDKPEEVKLATLPVKVDGSTLLVDLPKHAVAAIEVRLS